MKKQLHIVILILAVGFFLLPTSSAACATTTKKSCCKIEKTEKKDCCPVKNSKDEDQGCQGQCGHTNCVSSTVVSFGLFPDFDIDFKNDSFDFSPEKSKIHYLKTLISSGFSSIWLIPKIG